MDTNNIYLPQPIDRIKRMQNPPLPPPQKRKLFLEYVKMVHLTVETATNFHQHIITLNKMFNLPRNFHLPK